MLLVNSHLNLATLTFWFWHLCRGLIDGASSARVVLYQKSLHWHDLDGLVLFLQRRLLVTEQKLVLLMHHLTVAIPHPALLFDGIWAALQGVSVSLCQIPILIHGLWTWKMCWLGDLPPYWFCLPALGQVASVCFWIQPELKGCVDLVLGQLCASQIFSFLFDNLLVVSSLTTTKCLFYSQTSWGFHRSFVPFWLPVWQMWGCWHGGLVTKA